MPPPLPITARQIIAVIEQVWIPTYPSGSAEDVALRAVVANLTATLTSWEAWQASKTHEHRFRDYEVCEVCGQTGAAIDGCHHCNEVTPGTRCWWCLRMKETTT